MHGSAQGSLDDILARALEVGPRERASFLRSILGPDDPLLAKALAALGLDVEASGPPDVDFELRDRCGTEIGPWKLVRRLAAGGMGEVYLAERRGGDYTQRVAIKLVRPDLLTPSIRSRLKAERQILARLTHPNIARLLDGGTTADGVPYLVMEYVEGVPIDEFCDQHRLTIRQRLALFREVCAAVHAAHQNLVVHRDLKPSNIFVTADGSPKLLDFGIAKLLDPGPVVHTVAMTAIDIRIMTPDHASPEQISGGAITTASDVYVLGIVLFQLLAGRKPFHLDAMRLPEIEKAVCHTLPPLPSHALGAEGPRAGSDPSAEFAANARGTTPRRLKRELSGDLDNIVFMAMRKEPDRRYSSAEQLSADIARYLAGEPVIARPDSWQYRTAKFVRRHALGVGFSAAIAALLTFTSIAMFVQNQRIERERAIAEQERNRSEEVAQFLVRLFRVADPSESRGKTITAREILEQGARRVEQELKSQPETQATLMETIGRVYLELGSIADARPQLVRALEQRRQLYAGDHPENASSLSAMGKLELAAGHLDVAESYFRDAFAMNQRLYGREHLAVASSLQELGQLLKVKGDLPQTEQVLEQSLQLFTVLLGPENSSVSSVMNELAQVRERQGKHAAAEQLYRRALALDEKLLGGDHPQVMHSLHNLAIVLQSQGDLATAEVLFRDSVAQLKRVLGEKHPDAIDAMGNYARLLQKAGRLTEAEAIYRQMLALNREVRGADHPYVGYDLVNVGSVLYARGEYDAAEQSYRQALEIYQASLPGDHLYVASGLMGLSRTLIELKRPSEAQSSARTALAIRIKTLPAGHIQTIEAQAVVACIILLQDPSDLHRAAVQDLYRQINNQLGPTDQRTLEIKRWLDAAATD